MNIRPTRTKDIPALQTVTEATGLFPAEMLPDQLAPFLSNGDSEGLWLTCETEGAAIGFCYAVPEQLAEGTWNMLAIAVLPDQQGSGAGRALVTRLENTLRERDQRVLIADTSGTEEFEATRAFYRRAGYTEEARIRDFWAEGDDKIVFWKRL